MIYSWNPFRIQKFKVCGNEESFFAYDWSSVREEFSVQPWSTILYISRIQGPHNCKVFFTLQSGILINSSIILIRLWNGSILINYRWLGGIVVASGIMVNDRSAGLIIMEPFLRSGHPLSRTWDLPKRSRDPQMVWEAIFCHFLIHVGTPWLPHSWQIWDNGDSCLSLYSVVRSE